MGPEKRAFVSSDSSSTISTRSTTLMFVSETSTKAAAKGTRRPGPSMRHVSVTLRWRPLASKETGEGEASNPISPLGKPTEILAKRGGQGCRDNPALWSDSQRFKSKRVNFAAIPRFWKRWLYCACPIFAAESINKNGSTTPPVPYNHEACHSGIQMGQDSRFVRFPWITRVVC